MKIVTSMFHTHVYRWKKYIQIDRSQSDCLLQYSRSNWTDDRSMKDLWKRWTCEEMLMSRSDLGTNVMWKGQEHIQNK